MDDKKDIKKRIIEILKQAEPLCANDNIKTHFSIKNVLIVLVLIFFFILGSIMCFYSKQNKSQPVAAVTITQIDSLIKEVAACKGRKTTSYRTEIKKAFNIYDFNNIDKHTAEEIIKYLQSFLCESLEKH